MGEARGKVYPHYLVENQKDIQVSGGLFSMCLIKLSLPSILMYFYITIKNEVFPFCRDV